MKNGIVLKVIVFSIMLVLCLVLNGCAHKHTSSGEYEADDDGHFFICDKCGEEYDKEAHVWDEGIVLDKANEYKDGLSLFTCTVCGYEKEMVVPKLEHSHSLLPEYETDINYHWKTCQKCFEIVDKELHSWDEGVRKEEDGYTTTTYTCKICGHKKVSVEGIDTYENPLYYVSNEVDIDTVDILPTAVGDKTYKWESSDPNVYQINGLKGTTSRRYQTHQKQTVTITVYEYSGETVTTKTKEIIVKPVVFKKMPNPKAVYFSVGSQDNYRRHSERYLQEGTLFSTKFKENMDMLYYAFASPQADGSVGLSDVYINEVMALKDSGIRVLMVIGGVSKTNLQALTTCSADDTMRAKLVKSILDLVAKYHFDGVDMDWEYPGTSGLDGYTTEIDKVNLNKLMRDLRSGLNKMQDKGGSPYILSAAIPATRWGAQRYQFKSTSTIGGLNEYCDYINMMSYDSNNPDYCTHLAPMYTSTQTHDYQFGCAFGVSTFTNYGLSQNKIILGAAAYGKTYKVEGTVSSTATYPALNNKGTLSIVEGIDGSFASGTIYYSGIVELTKRAGWTQYIEKNNGKIVGAYLYNASLKLYITYDSVETVKAKCEYAKQKGLGIMVCAYGEDSTDTIVNTICDNL